MRNLIKFIVLILFSITPIFSIVACSCDSRILLEIKNDEIYDDNIELTKLDNIAEMFLFSEPKKSNCKKGLRWNWNLNNRKKLTGKANCGYFDYKNEENKNEYWILIVQKNNSKNIHVSDYEFSDIKPLDWEA